MSGFIKNHKEAEVSQERKLYTGLCKVDITNINPNFAKIKEMFGDNAKEPSYVSKNENNNRKVRLDFFYENEDGSVKSKFAIFLEDEVRTSQAGNIQFINTRGQSTWGKSLEAIADNPKMSWFNTETAREAKVGEVTLYELLIALTNCEIGEDTDLQLADIDALFDGDVTELNDINDELGKGIRGLLGVRITDSGNYQDLYTAYFQRGHVAGDKVMMKKAQDADYPYKADFQNSSKFQEWDSKRPEGDERIVEPQIDMLKEDVDDLF